MLCDSNIERYIRKNNYESFNRLTPTKRFTEKFRMETGVLNLDIKETDEIVGQFYFDKKCNDEVTFTDKEQYKAEQAIKNSAGEIDYVINIGKMKQGDLDYIKKRNGNAGFTLPQV